MPIVLRHPPVVRSTSSALPHSVPRSIAMPTSSPSPSPSSSPTRLYPLAAAAVLTLWATGAWWFDLWQEIASNAVVTFTMVFGSFIAGATSEGGGAVAFPVFTKVLGIPSADARLFSLMIQSVGMTMAGLFIAVRRIPVIWGAIWHALASGAIGLVLGSLLLRVPDPFPKLVFTFVTAMFGLFLAWNRWGRGATHPRRTDLPLSGPASRPIVRTLWLAGLLGGAVTSMVGVGVDMVVFILLTLRYGIDEKRSTPTTVVLMGLLSVVGFAWYGLHGAIPSHVWGYWMSAVPVVIFGAPLGAWVCSRIARDTLIGLLLALITLEVASTLWLIPIAPGIAAALAALSLATGALFAWLVRLRDAENASNG